MQKGEPSVEEILESIKKVIARDNKDSAQTERYRRETEGVVRRRAGANFGITPMAENGNGNDLDEDLPEDELDERQPGAEDGEKLPEEYELDTPDGEVLDLGAAATRMLDEYAAEPGDSPLVEPVSAHPDEQEPAATLPAMQVPETPVEALAPMPEASETPFASIAPEGETPLERMVRESLRPMLREWLDTNLPPIVERMVKSELERIMGKSS